MIRLIKRLSSSTPTTGDVIVKSDGQNTMEEKIPPVKNNSNRSRVQFLLIRRLSSSSTVNDNKKLPTTSPIVSGVNSDNSNIKISPLLMENNTAQQPDHPPLPDKSSLDKNKPHRSRERIRTRSRSLTSLTLFFVGSERKSPPVGEEKIGLISKLKSMLLSIEKNLIINDEDLEIQLEHSKYLVEHAVSNLIERSGLRQIIPNTTLKEIKPNDDDNVQFFNNVQNAWSPINASIFNVRCGPNYRKTKLKALAKPETIYNVIAVDAYETEYKIPNISRFMKMQDLEKISMDNKTGLPDLFIINFMLPLNEPKLPNPFSSEEDIKKEQDSRTVSFHFIMKLSDWAKNNCNHPSVELVKRFIKHSTVNEHGGDGSMRERLKIIVQVLNPEELNLGRVERGFYKKFNGLPFLYREYNSEYKHGMNWFQADFDGHKSGYTTRMARYALLSFCEKIVAGVAFLVESETDEEMPERILGCINLYRTSCKKAVKFVKPKIQLPLVPIVKSNNTFSTNGNDNLYSWTDLNNSSTRTSISEDFSNSNNNNNNNNNNSVPDLELDEMFNNEDIQEEDDEEEDALVYVDAKED